MNIYFLKQKIGKSRENPIFLARVALREKDQAL
jgi:hypothetical protein